MLSLAAGCNRNKSDSGLEVSAPVLDLASSCEQVSDLSDYIADVRIVRLAAEPVIYSGSGKILTYDGKDSSVWNFISDGKKGIYWQSSSSDTQAPLSFCAADDGYFYFAYTEYGLEQTQDPLKKYLIDECGLVLGENENIAIVGVKFRL